MTSLKWALFSLMRKLFEFSCETTAAELASWKLAYLLHTICIDWSTVEWMNESIDSI